MKGDNMKQNKGSKTPKVAKKLTIATLKGGTGKTTVSYNLGFYLADTLNKKVLMIDLDPQCNLTSNCHLNIFSDDLPSIADLLENAGKKNVAPTDYVILGPTENVSNLDIIPSTMFLHGTETKLVQLPAREQIINNYIEDNADFFNFYDYIIFDTGPNFGVINQNAFYVSDHIILCCDPDVNSANGCDVFMIIWDELRSYMKLERKVDAFIINNVERTNISKDFMDYINSHELFSKIVLKSHIPHATLFKECTAEKTHIVKKSPSSKGAKALKEVAKELFERGIL